MAHQKPLPFQIWAKRQAAYGARHLHPTKAYDMPFQTADLDFWGMKGVLNAYGDTKAEGFVLDAEITADLLGASHDALRTDIVDVLIGSILSSFHHTFEGRDSPTMFVEGHGRESWDSQLDVSSTVGWFTTVSPLYVPLRNSHSVVDTVKRSKDMRKRVPANGWPYMVSRYANKEGRQMFGKYGFAEIFFNYMGLYQQLEQDDALFRQHKPDWELISSTGDVGEKTPRWSLIEISAVVDHGCLEVSFNYNVKMKHVPEIQQWIAMTRTRICEAIAELKKLDSTPTLADFPGLKLTYAGLSQLTQMIPCLGLTSWHQIESLYQCTPVQSAMLLSHQMGSENYRTWSISELRHHQGVRLDSLQQAWQQVVNRHPVLRTIFIDSLATENDSGVFHQVVIKGLQGRLLNFTASDDAAVDRLRSQKQMDLLEDAALHQLTVCETPTRTLIKLEMSHTIIDGASMYLVFKELCAAYDSKLDLGPGFAYGTYIAHLEEQKSTKGNSLTYWKNYLAGSEPCLLPTSDIGKGNQGPLHANNVELSIGVQSLLAFCENENITLPNLLQTAWAMVLRSYTNSDQVCFGYAASGRDVELEGVEQAVGPFINVMVCRAAVSPSSTPLGMAEAMHQEFITGLEHQFVSLAEIFHEMGISDGSLFNTGMSIQRMMPTQAGEGSGLSLKALEYFDPSEVTFFPQ
jgi:non-ribosomal peptide synthase protein (TIGR01720 family)